MVAAPTEDAMKTITLALLATAAFGCHHDKKATTTPAPTNDQPAAAEQTKPAPQVTQDQQVSPNLALSGDIVQLCGIKAASLTADPHFDYNKDELTPEDRTVLDQLATCMTTGALKGKAVSLVGREHLGVGQPQLAVTTRGALDATGTDEAGYAKDRRVDVQLKQD
jgi:peptidoglycan-associated lipoprotein